jgi:predicted secreted protein
MKNSQNELTKKNKKQNRFILMQEKVKVTMLGCCPL